MTTTKRGPLVDDVFAMGSVRAGRCVGSRMKPLTIKNLQAILRSKFGALTPKMHQLAETALAAMVVDEETRDDLRRAQERINEETRVRPEHERVLILLTKPLADGGSPAIEVYSDARVKLKIAFEDDRLPLNWEHFIESTPVQQTEIQVIPDWLRTPNE